ncbi:RDD family protein [Sphaerisporangium krabiense]|uniref:Putative RDD family membrane protein YckC n=1 Tax=Sphaerisporangium krabiense TaxID=763782 RepID=A0A7W9DQJ5_9ACTN|nr:RDD family protein [Sphaerisporangium krabiense]MBB5626485.1 putative RDD family membrane protein YckC [Sphaerisporangium krabiense]
MDPLRGDLDVLMENVVTWAVPALVVVVGFLACVGGRGPRSVAWRTAGALCVIAVVEPLTPAYAAGDGSCGLLPILSAEWFATVMGAWGSTQFCLLGAAVLVLVASRMTVPATSEHVAAAPPDGVTWRRPIAVLVDYAIIIVILTFGLPLVMGLTDLDRPFSMSLDFGLLGEGVSLLSFHVEAGWLIVLFVVFLYFWGQHSRWGRTLGKRLLRIHVVCARTGGRPPAGRAALRALIFPMALFVPVVGPLVLVLDGLWTLVDPGARTLHDRWARTEVARRMPDVRSGV